MEAKVCIFKRDGRKFYEAQWRDPVTGRKRTRSTGKQSKRDAERAAAVIEADLRAGRFKDCPRITWSEFRDRYETEVLAGHAWKTAQIVFTTFNHVERLIDPALLATLDAAQISRFQHKLRKENLAESSIAAYLRHLKVALRWSHRVGLLDIVPHIKMPRRAGMKGRPITSEEYERMLDKVRNGLTTSKSTQVGPEVVESYQHLLTGLWWSGLRLGEAMELEWTDDRRLCVDFSGRRPMFRIRAASDKGRKDRILPMAPEFAEFLQQTPKCDREGFVFNPRPIRSRSGRPILITASAVISRIGKAATVKVAETKRGVKYASAHDFRRSFGFRWAMRVMPPTLMMLMRHESIQTTQDFYVGRNAEAAADAIWEAIANTSANTSLSAQENAVEGNGVSLEAVSSF